MTFFPPSADELNIIGPDAFVVFAEGCSKVKLAFEIDTLLPSMAPLNLVGIELLPATFIEAFGAYSDIVA